MIEYRQVVDFPGYRVGSDGSVWSWRCKGGTKTWRWKQLKPWFVRGGYKIVGLNLDKRYYRYVHILVLEAFVGPKPEGCEACHNNNNPSDNRPENLRWDTPKNNCVDRAQNGFFHKTSKGEKHGMSKLTWEQVKEIRRLYAEEKTKQTDLAKQFNVTPTNICEIIKNKIWRKDGTS